MKVQFLADADLNKAILTGVVRREPTIDFASALEMGLRGLKDPAVLALAAREHRVLVSYDVNSMPLHFTKFTANQGRSAGVLLIPQRLEVATAIEDLILIWELSDAAEWQDRLDWLPL